MRYERIVSYVADHLWALEPRKWQEIVAVLSFRVAGGEFTAEEIQARVGSGRDAIQAPRGDVAVVPIRGTIAHRMSLLGESSGGASTEGIERALLAASRDPNVGTILLDVDSPGGTVTGVHELAGKIREIKGKGTQRIIALVNGMAASAAYWLAAQADEIVSIPSGSAGSIGVFTAHADLSKHLEQEGVKVSVISAGKHKVEGSPFAPLSDDAKAALQARVDEAYGWFVADVAAGRNVNVSEVREGFGEGRALSAKDALAAGLIDKIETVDAVLSRLTASASPSMMRADASDDDLRRRLELA